MQELLFTCLVSVSIQRKNIQGTVYHFQVKIYIIFVWYFDIYYSNLSEWSQNQQKDRYKRFHVMANWKKDMDNADALVCTTVVIRCLYTIVSTAYENKNGQVYISHPDSISGLYQ